MKHIVTFGELMLRLSPTGDFEIGQTNQFDYCYGGSEANVAASLAVNGIPTYFVSLLPDNEIGKDAMRKMRSYGIDTKWLKFAQGRMGIYFSQAPYVEGNGRRCIYDRKTSSFSLAKKDDFDWKAIFKNAAIFHFSGITPALSPELAQICLQACKTARELGVLVSCDINYRESLWKREKAAQTMRKLCRYADILFINEQEPSIFGFDACGSDMMSKQNFAEMTDCLRKMFPAQIITTVARVRNKLGNLCVQAILRNGNNYFRSSMCAIGHIADQSGAGDAYAAAVLYGLTMQHRPQRIVDDATKACMLKHKCSGDISPVVFD